MMGTSYMYDGDSNLILLEERNGVVRAHIQTKQYKQNAEFF